MQPKQPKAEVKEEVKEEKKFVAYADFEFRKKQYKKGDVFVPPHDVYPDPSLDEFRRTNSKKVGSSGHAFYYEIDKGKEEPEVFRVVLPVE